MFIIASVLFSKSPITFIIFGSSNVQFCWSLLLSFNNYFHDFFLLLLFVRTLQCPVVHKVSNNKHF